MHEPSKPKRKPCRNERDFWESISIGAERAVKQKSHGGAHVSQVNLSSFFAGIMFRLFIHFSSPRRVALDGQTCHGIVPRKTKPDRSCFAIAQE